MTVLRPGVALAPLAALAEWRSAEGYAKRAVRLWRYDRVAQALMLPRGLWPLPPEWGPYQCRDDRLVLPLVRFRWRGPVLDPVQQRVARAFYQAGGGLLVAPGGSGKTIIGLRCLAAWRQPALWIADTNDLAAQALDQARRCYRLPESAFGLALDGQIAPGTHFTVGLRQTLADVRDPSFLRRFGAVLYDEGDRAASDSAWRTLSRYPARYRCGATATPERADKLHPIVAAVVGRSIVRVTQREAVASGRYLVPSVLIVPTGRRYAWRGSWPALQGERASDPQRNRAIAVHADQMVRQGHNVLVLVQRLQHAADMARLIGLQGVPVRHVTGQLAPEERQARIAVARRGGGIALVATKLLDRGVDLPVIDRVFLVDPYRAAPTTEQQVYRVTRTAAEQGKTDAAIIDYWDDCVQFERQQRARLRLYLEMGLRIEGMPPGYRPPRYRLRDGVVSWPEVNGKSMAPKG